jgi:hypothetical protein
LLYVNQSEIRKSPFLIKSSNAQNDLVQNHKQFPKYNEDASTGQTNVEPVVKLLDNSFKQFNMYSSIIRQISEESSRDASNENTKSEFKPPSTKHGNRETLGSLCRQKSHDELQKDEETEHQNAGLMCDTPMIMNLISTQDNRRKSIQMTSLDNDNITIKSRGNSTFQSDASKSKQS